MKAIVMYQQLVLMLGSKYREFVCHVARVKHMSVYDYVESMQNDAARILSAVLGDLVDVDDDWCAADNKWLNLIGA